MKIGIMGAGAVGGFFGSVLQKAGHDVIFLARGAHLKVMQEKGLTVHTSYHSTQIESGFTDDLYDLKEADLLLICIKSIDTEDTARQLLPILKKDACILTMQNGVDNEELLSKVFGKERVFSCATYVQATLLEPGVIKQNGDCRLVIGELDLSSMSIAKKIELLLNEAGINTKHSSEIMNNKWKKYIWNVTFNPLSAAMGVNVGEIVDNEHLRTLAENICREVISVAQKQGIQVSESFIEKIFANTQVARDHETSMLQDRINGKKMELESICGYVIRKGKELKVQVPTIETVYHALKYLEMSNRKIASK